MRRALAFTLALVLVPALAPAQVRQTLDDPSAHALDAFHAALARGSALVTVWGASHVASDQFTSVMRARLVARHGDGGPGQFFPARPLALYDRRDVVLDDASAFRGVSTRGHRVADDYGRAGIALDTTGPARACARIPNGAAIRRVEAWAAARPGGRSLSITADRARATASTEGTGPTPVRVHLDVTGAHEVCIAADGALRSYGVIAESGRGVVVESFGVPGARAQDALLWNEPTFAAQLAERPPDLAVLAYGTNESAQHRSAAALHGDLAVLIARLHRHAPAASCLVIGPSDRGGPQTERVRDAYRDAAREGGCAFFDLLAWTGGLGSLAEGSARGWALSDRVHFTDETYGRLGDAIARAIAP